MAYNRFVPLYSTESGAVPTASALIEGELAVNIADGTLFTRSGSVVKLISTSVPQSTSFATTATQLMAGNQSINGALSVTGNLSVDGYEITSSRMHVHGTDSYIEFETRHNLPTIPDSGHIKVYSRNVAYRNMLTYYGPSDVSTQVQPSLFNNMVTMILPNTTTTFNTFGGSSTNVGTVSHPAVTARYGWMANVATGAGTGGSIVTASVAWAAAMAMRGSSDTGSGGFFFFARLGFPDTAYSASAVASGSRLFVGLSANTINGVIANDSTSLGNAVGFRCSNPNGETIWQAVARDGSTMISQSTGVTLDGQQVYDFYLFAPPSASWVGWRIDNLLTNTAVSGTLTASLPTANTPMTGGFELRARTGTKNVRLQRLYLETDR